MQKVSLWLVIGTKVYLISFVQYNCASGGIGEIEIGSGYKEGTLRLFSGSGVFNLYIATKDQMEIPKERISTL